MTNITKAAQEALEAFDAMTKGNERDSDGAWGLIVMPSNASLEKADKAASALRAALQDKAGEVAVAIDNLHNERRDGMTNAIFPPVQIGTRLFAAQPAPVVPDGFALVPVEPTDEMEAEAENNYELSGSPFPDWKAAYRAMIAASQQKGGSAG